MGLSLPHYSLDNANLEFGQSRIRNPTLSEPGRAERWSGLLAKQWMQNEAESAGVFYADGHVR